MAVIDILPNCVSSVYFIYDNKWEKYSLGKVSNCIFVGCCALFTMNQLSALREACLANEMHDAGAPGMNALYLGEFDRHRIPVA